VEAGNTTGDGYISPYDFVDRLSDLCRADDVLIPCSSGGAFTVMMQVFRQRAGQVMITDKGLAAMGYGLSGAIGAAFAQPQRRVVLVEGDGGFAQNMQEIGTAAINRLNLKMFVFDDSGYASIRMTQRSYFGGRYVGCDRSTGLGLPDWDKLFGVWNVPSLRIGPGFDAMDAFHALFDAPGPAAFLVSLDPQQTYFPKITSRVTAGGAMESNPLHRMTPELDTALLARVGRYLAD
jgi:acetolactate synthase-1/2/3 large subunit